MTVDLTVACTAETLPSYRATDLGTLGGPESGAQDINDADQVVGWSVTSGPDLNFKAFVWEAGVFKNLNPGGRYGYSFASSISPRGQIIGTAGIETGGTAGLIWQTGVASDLGNLGSAYSGPGGVDDSGTVVGTSALRGAGNDDPPEIDHAFIWRDGVMTDLGTLGGKNSGAGAINALGQIVGWSQTSTGENHLVIWQEGAVTDLGPLGDSYAFYPIAINGSGQVVGSLLKTRDGPWRAFLWEKGVLTEINSAQDYSSFASDINEGGQVVGYRTTVQDGPEHAYLWQKGVMTDLSIGFERSAAYGINDSGKVVGSARRAGGDWHATLWIAK